MRKTPCCSIFALSTVLLSTVARAEFHPGPMVLERVFSNIAFNRPLQLLEFPDDSGRMVVVERDGYLKVFDKNSPTAPTTWLDITDRVATERDQALMSLAFDPDFATNGQIYLHYSYDDGTRFGPGRLSRFTAGPPGAATIDPATEEVILAVPEPFQDHNGGSIEFGPDGMLYWALGDGGSRTGFVPPEWQPPLDAFDPLSQDPIGNGQSTTDLLGNILRIDVTSTPDEGIAYRIPTDNPFYNGGPDGPGTRKEIYAYGLRNPWRMTFDPVSGRLIAVDVGAKSREEIDEIVPGGNYGWSGMEGDICFPPGSTDCTPGDFQSPIVVHVWETNSVRSLTGGYFYEDTRLPELNGTFVYADYVWGTVWAMQYDGATATSVQLTTSPTGLLIAGFGRDNSGEVYLLQYSTTGGVYRLVRDPSATPTPTMTPVLSPTPTATSIPTSPSVTTWSLR